MLTGMNLHLLKEFSLPNLLCDQSIHRKLVSIHRDGLLFVKLRVAETKLLPSIRTKPSELNVYQNWLIDQSESMIFTQCCWARNKRRWLVIASTIKIAIARSRHVILIWELFSDFRPEWGPLSGYFRLHWFITKAQTQKYSKDPAGRLLLTIGHTKLQSLRGVTPFKIISIIEKRTRQKAVIVSTTMTPYI